MTPFVRFAALSLVTAVVAACSSSDPAASPSASGSSSGGADAPTIFGGDRPATLHVPASYVPGKPTALVVMLHGYSVDGLVEELFLGITPLSDERGFLYVHPDGTIDSTVNRFWNATDACCNIDDSPVDDSTYLSTLVKDISASYSVDPKRVFFIGHSNGGFMSYRMACDHADQIAAIVSLAGATWLDTSKCKPSVPVSVLEIHGTADTEVVYDGGGPPPYPSAPVTVADWAAYDGCSATLDTTAPNLDFDSELPGAETTVGRHLDCASGGKSGGDAELWTIEGGTHLPALSDASRAMMIDYLLAHPKP